MALLEASMKEVCIDGYWRMVPEPGDTPAEGVELPPAPAEAPGTRKAFDAVEEAFAQVRKERQATNARARAEELARIAVAEALAAGAPADGDVFTRRLAELVAQDVGVDPAMLLSKTDIATLGVQEKLRRWASWRLASRSISGFGTSAARRPRPAAAHWFAWHPKNFLSASVEDPEQTMGPASLDKLRAKILDQTVNKAMLHNAAWPPKSCIA
jgi:hypothetical protein